MLFVLVLIRIAIGLVLDLIAALVAVLVAPGTGIEFLDAITYWQWFWTAILVGAMLMPALTMNDLDAS